MDRLTEWNRCPNPLGPSWVQLRPGVGKQWAFAQLALYEDTGIEPKEIDHLRDLAKMVSGIAPDRLREIVEAEKDGRLYTAHDVAVILAETTGDYCACNINGNDEWLPNFCKLQDACPDTDGVACWEQYLKYRPEAEAALKKGDGKDA